MLKFYLLSLFLILVQVSLSAVSINGSFVPFSRYNPIIVQIGAFEGYETTHLSKSHPYGTIYAFEPEISSFANLLQNSRELKNVTALNLAVNAFSGTCILFGEKDSASLYKNNLYQPTQEVKCVNLDDWCAATNIDRIDLLKLDTNGYDYKILENSPRSLEKTFAVIIQTFSSLNAKQNQNLSKVRLFLKSYGFELVDHQTETDVKNGYKIKRGEAFFLRDYAFNPLFR